MRKETNKKQAIVIRGIKKKYRLGAIGGRTLQKELQSWWAKKQGREDPNTKIGTSTKDYGKEFFALDGIDLTIYQGETVGIIGANGAGKSTLLKLISQITAPTEGEIDIYGRVTSMLEVGTGFHREMTGRENIYMNGAILGMTKAEIEKRIDKIIEFSEISEFIDTPIKRYSSGMYVKLAFSVAAHLKSEIMIMDEVLAVGDMAFQNKCIEKMREAAALEGRTVLYVSHNMNTIRALCKRCIVIDKGRVVFDGDTESAIKIYMERSLGSNATDMDLREKSRSRKISDTGLTMEHLRLLNKVNAVYENKEELELELKLRIEKPIGKVKCRLTLRTDTDAGLGTAWSDLIDLDEPGICALQMKMPLDMIAKGTFYASIGIYQMDEIGKAKALDHISRAFKIEVEGSPVWNTSAFGNVNLPELETRKLTNI